MTIFVIRSKTSSPPNTSRPFLRCFFFTSSFLLFYYTREKRSSFIYLLGAAAENDNQALEGAIHGLGGWIECFPKAELKGVIYGVGATDVGDIKGMPAVAQAYQMGHKI